MEHFHILKNYIPFIIPNNYSQEKCIIDLERNNNYLNSILKSDIMQEILDEGTTYHSKKEVNEIFNSIKNNSFGRYTTYLVKNIIQKYNKEVSYVKQIRYIPTYFVKNNEMECFEDKIYLKIKEYDDIFKYQDVLNSNRKMIIKHKKLLNKQIYNNIASEISSSFLNLNNDKEIIQKNYHEIINYGILVEENKNCNKCTLLKKWFSKYTNNFNHKDTNNIIYVEKVLDKKKYCTLLIDE